MKIDKVLINLMRAARKAKKATQWEMAVKLGVTQQTISTWERTGNVPENRLDDVKAAYGLIKAVERRKNFNDRRLIELLIKFGNKALKEKIQMVVENGP